MMSTIFTRVLRSSGISRRTGWSSVSRLANQYQPTTIINNQQSSAGGSDGRTGWSSVSRLANQYQPTTPSSGLQAAPAPFSANKFEDDDHDDGDHHDDDYDHNYFRNQSPDYIYDYRQQI